MRNLPLVCALLCSFATGLFGQICPAPALTCEAATLSCGYYLNNQFVGSSDFASAPSGNYNFCGTLENTQFLKIVPCSSQLIATVVPGNCLSGNGLQVALLEDCQGQVIACNGGGLGMGTAPVGIGAAVEPGKPYILMIDGYLGDQCDFTLDIQGIDNTIPSGTGTAMAGFIEFQTLPCGPATLTAHLPVCQQDASSGCSQSWADFYVDSCLGIQWNLPPGAEIISPFPNAFTITVQFNQTVTNGMVSVDFIHNCPGINEMECANCIPGCCTAPIPPIFISSPASSFTNVPCDAAPLYCAGSLDQENFNNGCTFAGFGWWQSDLWNLLSPCFPLENPNLYAIAACGDILNLDIDVSNCVNHHGLEFALMGGGACDFLYSLGNCTSVLEGSTGQMSVPVFNNPDNVYYLVVDGIDLDACDFHVSASQLDSMGLPIASCQYGTDPFLQVFDSTYTVLFAVNSYPGTQVTGDSGTLINGVFTSDPILCGTPYAFEIITNGSCTQTLSGNAPCLLPPDCPNFNLPAPLADSCFQAPLLCGNFLEGYCSSTVGLTADQPPYVNGQLPDFENNGWLRFSPCKDSIAIEFQVFDCLSGDQLGFFLLSGNCDTLTPLSFTSAVVDSSVIMTAGGLIPGDIYYLIIDGYYGAECSFKTHVLSGIGTAAPGPSTCTCTDGYIDGPDDLCPADIATYTLIPPVCDIQTGPPVGGNGIYCPPPVEACPAPQKDSLVLHWVIPPFMNFLSDSINVSTITVQVDSSLLGIDTVLTGTVSVYWEHINLGDSTAVDSNAYCSCTAVACPPTMVTPKNVTVHHNVDYDYGVLTCIQPCYLYNGVPYCSPGVFMVSQTNCQTQFLVLVSNQAAPNANAGPDKTICFGESAVIGSNVFPNPVNSYFWSIGGNTPMLNVSPTVTTTYSLTVTNTVNGCTNTDAVTVSVIGTAPLISFQPPVSICAGDCATLAWGEVVCPAASQAYTEVLTSYLGCDSIVNQTVLVTPQLVSDLGTVGSLNCDAPSLVFFGTTYTQAGTYTIPDPASLFCDFITFTILADFTPPVVQIDPVLPICSGESITLTTSSNLSGLTYEWNTGAGTPQITVAPASTTGYSLIASNPSNGCTATASATVTVNQPQTVQLGVVGTLSCAQSCVTYNGMEYCQPGMYSDTANCTISQFEIAFDPALPTIQLGVTGTLSCTQPCVTYNGQQYCQPGIFSDTSNCVVNQFEIAFDPALPVVELGTVGSVSCSQPCVAFNGQSYCQPGTYADTSNCVINQFEIGYDPALPVFQLGVVGTISCGQPCAIFNGQEYCQPGIYSDTANCTINQFEITYDQSMPTVQLGVVGTLSCTQPCATFNGQSYCQPGMYTDTLNCTINQFEIASDLSFSTAQLGLVGTLSCAQPCVMFNGKPYCQPGSYTDTLNCVVNTFEIGYDSLLPMAQIGIVDSLTCAHPCVTFNGTTYCQSGTYTQVIGCEIQEFEIIDALVPMLDLGDDQTVVSGEPVILQAETNAQAVSIKWSDQFTALTGNDLSIQVRPTENTLYSIEIQDVNGCLLDDSLWVFVNPKTVGWYAPNAFRPGESGDNSGFTLFVDPAKFTEIQHLEVYNRWGELIFSRDNLTPGITDLGWDGKHNGKMLDPAVFVWQAVLLQSDGTALRVTGEVTLLR